MATKKVTKKKTPTKKKTARKPRAEAAVETHAARKPVTVTVSPLNEDEIRARAFEIFSAGQNPDNPDADWYQAERELS